MKIVQTFARETKDKDQASGTTVFCEMSLKWNNGHRNRGLVWHECNKAFQEMNLKLIVKYGGGSVMVQGYFAAGRPG